MPLIASLAASAGQAATNLVDGPLVTAMPGRSALSTGGPGLWLVTRSGRVIAYGDARNYGQAHTETPFVGAASTSDGRGYWLVTRGGGVYGFGDAAPFGSLGGRPLATPAVGIAATADGRGYWLATAGGTVYGFGDAIGHSPAGGSAWAGPVVGIVADPATGGYWLATSKGKVLGYDGAPSYGEAHLATAVVAMAATPDGRGYWLVAKDGQTAALGDAGRHGALNGAYPRPVVGMAAASTGNGYWLAAANGHVFAYGNVGKAAPLPGLASVVAIVAVPSNEAAPSATAARPDGLNVATASLPALVPGQPYSAQLAASGGTSPYSWTVVGGALPPGLALGAAGTISGTAGPGLSGPYDFTVQVTGSSAPSPLRAAATLTIAVRSTEALAVVTTTLPAAVESITYAAQLVAQGGGPPYAWTLSDGTLPPGLSLSATGVISGVPVATGSYNFTAEVTDGPGTPAEATAQLSIAVASPALSNVPVSQMQSQNWSGYVATGGPFTAVSGDFTVPSLSPGAPGQAMVAEWVGIGGSDNRSLIQAGVTEVPDVDSTSEVDVSAWWEVLPAASQPVMTMAVQPGDEVSIAIGQISGSDWAIHLTDSTNGQNYAQNVSYMGPGTSAEWIVEAPTDTQADQQLALAPYSPAVNFSGLSATGGFTAMSDVVMEQDNQQVSTPSALTSAGFRVVYGSTTPTGHSSPSGARFSTSASTGGAPSPTTT